MANFPFTERDERSSTNGTCKYCAHLLDNISQSYALDFDIVFMYTWDKFMKFAIITHVLVNSANRYHLWMIPHIHEGEGRGSG